MGIMHEKQSRIDEKRDNPWQIDFKNKNSERYLAVGVGVLVKFGLTIIITIQTFF
jgi:hypothetical protein